MKLLDVNKVRKQHNIMKTLQKQSKIFARRKSRIRAKIHGTATRPRLSIFKSLKFIYAQIIDDDKGHTLVSADTKGSKAKKPVEKASELGVDIAKKAIAAKIKKVVFDRSGYIYTGKIKVVADAARQGGLEF
jgi:large subunit ribosomal protein L18